MMKLLVLSALVAFAAADVSHLRPRAQVQPSRRLPVAPPAPIHPGQEIRILRQEQDIFPDGTYQFAYDTENGISAQEQGQQVQIGPDSGNAAQGSYSWTSPEGEQIQVQYVADENGFQPQSNAIPTPPPIPAQIQKALDWIAAHPEPQQPGRHPQGSLRFRRSIE